MVMVTNNGRIAIASAVSRNGNYHFYHKIKLNNWYKIIIEQISINGKVKWRYLRPSLTEPNILIGLLYNNCRRKRDPQG